MPEDEGTALLLVRMSLAVEFQSRERRAQQQGNSLIKHTLLRYPLGVVKQGGIFLYVDLILT